MKNCQAIAVLATLLLFSMTLGLSHGAPAAGNNDNSLNLLQNVSLSLHVLENVTLNTIKSEYMTLCKLGLEAAELTQEETELGLPAVTIQTAAQNLKDICKWLSNSTVSATNCTTTAGSAETVKNLCTPVITLKTIIDELQEVKAGIQDYNDYSFTASKINEYIQELKEEASESVARYISA